MTAGSDIASNPDSNASSSGPTRPPSVPSRPPLGPQGPPPHYSPPPTWRRKSSPSAPASPQERAMVKSGEGCSHHRRQSPHRGRAPTPSAPMNSDLQHLGGAGTAPDRGANAPPSSLVTRIDDEEIIKFWQVGKHQNNQRIFHPPGGRRRRGVHGAGRRETGLGGDPRGRAQAPSSAAEQQLAGGRVRGRVTVGGRSKRGEHGATA